MRLTLRTLLAYRDRVLQPSDREDLHARIQNNEFSGNLLRRIDSVSSSRDVSAPPVLGNGLGADANSVAEYLDDSLPSSQVPEFERATLVSDVQVAELAHCHTILASGLGEHVDVPDALYEKVRTLAPRKDQSADGSGPIVRVDNAHLLPGRDAAATNPAGVTAPMVASAGETIKPEGLDLENATIAQEVPEYLVSSNRGTWLLPVAIGGLLAVLCLLIWQTLGPLDRVASLLSDSPENTGTSDSIASSDDGSAVDMDSDSVDVIPGEPAPVVAIDANASRDSDAGPSVQNDDSEVSSESLLPAPPTNSDLDSGNGSPIADSPASDLPVADPLQAPFATWQPGDIAEQSATVLVRDSNSHLTRLDIGEGIGVGNEIILPNTLATTLALPGGLQLQNLGNSVMTLVDVQSPDGKTQLPELEIDFCKCVLHNPTDTTKRLLLRDSKRPILIALEPNGRVAIDGGLRQARHGSILDARTGRRVRVLLQIVGSSQISDVAASTETPLPIGEAQAWIDAEKARQFAVLQIPSWLRPASTRPIDRIAAARLQRWLANGQENGTSITNVLDEITASGSPEVIALAVETQILLGDLGSLPRALDSDRLSGYWTELLGVARQSFAAGRISADGGRDQLISIGLPQEEAEQFVSQVVGQESASSFRDEAAALVEQLASPKLFKRVLAIYHLRALAGTSAGFLPHRPKREMITQWRKLVSSDRFKIVAPPDLVYERTAAAP